MRGARDAAHKVARKKAHKAGHSAACKVAHGAAGSMIRSTARKAVSKEAAAGTQPLPHKNVVAEAWLLLCANTTMAFPGLLEEPWSKPKPHADLFSEVMEQHF